MTGLSRKTFLGYTLKQAAKFYEIGFKRLTSQMNSRAELMKVYTPPPPHNSGNGKAVSKNNKLGQSDSQKNLAQFSADFSVTFLEL